MRPDAIEGSLIGSPPGVAGEVDDMRPRRVFGNLAAAILTARQLLGRSREDSSSTVDLPAQTDDTSVAEPLESTAIFLPDLPSPVSSSRLGQYSAYDPVVQAFRRSR